MIVLVIVGIVSLLAGLYVAAMIWDAKHSTENAPRTDMFLCDRHGAIPQKYVMQLDMAGITENPLPYCPFCYDEKIKIAREKYGEKPHGKKYGKKQ